MFNSWFMDGSPSLTIASSSRELTERPKLKVRTWGRKEQCCPWGMTCSVSLKNLLHSNWFQASTRLLQTIEYLKELKTATFNYSFFPLYVLLCGFR